MRQCDAQCDVPDRSECRHGVYCSGCSGYTVVEICQHTVEAIVLALGLAVILYVCVVCAGISDFTPPDLEIVGYRVFLGNGQVRGGALV